MTHALGNISTGIDREKQTGVSRSRPHQREIRLPHLLRAALCAGGCHHEAFVRYGDTGHPNLHYCDWIREWTDTCLQIYGAISAQNPEFLENFAQRKGAMKHLRGSEQEGAPDRRVSQHDEGRRDRDAAEPPRPPPRGRTSPWAARLAFSPGWEVDSAGGTAGLCQPVERDIYDCYVTCFWPAQVPDHLNNYPDWANKCAAATKDWRNLDLVFP